MKRYLAHIIVLLIILVPATHLALASQLDEGNCTSGTTLCNPLSGNPTSLAAFLQTILEKIILPIGAIIAVVAFILTGFSFVMARGNQTKLDNAKRALLYTSIGTAVLLGAWTISVVIQNTVTQLTH